VLNDGFTVLSDANLQITGADKKYFKAHITHGIIDFFQAINNKYIGDLDLSSLNHENTRANIIETWQQNKPYIYTAASFNGKFNPNTQQYGYTDFKSTSMLPSASCWILMYLSFNAHGWTFEGLDSLRDLWMTYPKASGEDDTGVKTGVFDIDDSGFVNISGSNPMTFGSTVGIDLSYVTNNGSYLEAQQDIEDFAIKVPNIEIGVSGFIPVVNYYVNEEERNIEFDTEYSAYIIRNVNSGYHITPELTFRSQGAPVPQATFNVQGNVVTYAPKAVKINWNEALIELKIKDFIKEMMMQKSVIAVADAYEKHIKFLSVDDRLSAEIVDLSDIF